MTDELTSTARMKALVGFLRRLHEEFNAGGHPKNPAPDVLDKTPEWEANEQVYNDLWSFLEEKIANARPATIEGVAIQLAYLREEARMFSLGGERLGQLVISAADRLNELAEEAGDDGQ